jgi:hypothetical protein
MPRKASVLMGLLLFKWQACPLVQNFAEIILFHAQGNSAMD